MRTPVRDERGRTADRGRASAPSGPLARSVLETDRDRANARNLEFTHSRTPPRHSTEVHPVMSAPNRKPLPEDPQGSPEGTSVPAGPVLYCARQPILDRRSQVHGYELLYRSGPENRFTASNADWASTVNVEQSSTAFGLDLLVGDRRAYVNLTRSALVNEIHRLLPRDRVVVEILESVTADDAVLDTCRRMRSEGWRLALDDYAGEPERAPFLDLVHVVKCDLVRWPGALDAREVARLRVHGVETLAEKVETPEQAQAALDAGHSLLQGYHFCRPEMIAVRDLPPAKVSVLRFMAEITTPDLSYERLEQVFRADVGLTLRLLRHLNSAAFGLRHEVQSVHHALELLGERPLRRWALMLAMMSLCEDRPHELLVTALSRARFAESVAPSTGLAEHGPELFLTGMLSLVDGMVGRSKDEVLSSLALPDEVRDAVLHRGSPYEPVLDLVTAYQHGDWSRVDQHRERCPLDDVTLDAAYLDSLQWAEAVAT